MSEDRSTPECCGSSRVVDALDEHFGVIARELRTLMATVSLDQRRSELCSIAALTGLGDADELTVHLQRAKAIGIPAAEALEAILVTTVHAGLRGIGTAVEAFRGVYDSPFEGQAASAYPPVPDVDGFDGAALMTAMEIYGDTRARAVLSSFRTGDETLTAVVERVVYAGINRRPVISHMERELCAIALLTGVPGRISADWHVRVALELGATPSQVRGAVVSQLAHVGFPRVLDMLMTVAAVVGAWSERTTERMSWD